MDGPLPLLLRPLTVSETGRKRKREGSQEAGRVRPSRGWG